MGSVKVTVYGRLKPQIKNSVSQEYELRYGDHEDQITFLLKSSVKKSYRFKKIFDERASQQQVFESVAKPVVQNLLLGYNGTILTYGQTGSGKTHTMSGDLRNWTNTGLIPRTIQEIFNVTDKDTVITISYCEIYNEHVYDLIKCEGVDCDLGSANKSEDCNGLTNLKNVSVHTVTTFHEALQLFSRGDANKMIAETSNNARSSRSHVIFSIGIEIPHPTEENLFLKPVLYLVDLAGSEKLSKCKTPMNNPWETRFINLSLHYLEQVLIALRQPGRIHIPYRNSLMTALLRNSLGGNCITSMIATFSLSTDDIDETMQTCRFAQRIALIKNEIKLSEMVSPQREIYLLKKENERLKNQLKLLSYDQLSERLNERDKEKCDEMVQRFIRENDFFGLPLTDIRRMEYCFQQMRAEILRVKDSFSSNEESRPIGSRMVYRKDLISDLLLDISNSVTTFEVEPQINFSDNRTSEKNSRRKRNPIDLPKVNITYKRWKSTELLTEKENSPKANRIEYSLHRQNTSEFEVCDQEILKNSEAKMSLCHFKSAPHSVTKNKDDKLWSGSSNFKLKFSGETEYKKLTCETAPKVSLQSDFLSQSVQTSHDRVLCQEAEKLMSEGVEKDERNSVQGSLNSNEPSKFSVDCVPLTGDKEVDEEILKFYESRYRIFKNN